MINIKLLNLIVILTAVSGFSQTTTSNKNCLSGTLSVEKVADTLVVNSRSEVKHEKLTLLISHKVTPEVFYIVNDKPVSREEYLKHNKN